MSVRVYVCVCSHWDLSPVCLMCVSHHHCFCIRAAMITVAFMLLMMERTCTCMVSMLKIFVNMLCCTALRISRLCSCYFAY